MAAGIRLEVATPSGLKLEVPVDTVTAPGLNGEFTVLPEHRPLLSALRAGVLRYTVDGQIHGVAVGTGFIEVGRDTVKVLSERFALREDIDSTKTQQELKEAEQKVATFQGVCQGGEYEFLTESLEWAQARLSTHALQG